VTLVGPVQLYPEKGVEFLLPARAASCRTVLLPPHEGFGDVLKT